MNIIEWMHRFDALNKLILNGEATSLKAIGKKMSLSPRQVSHLIKVMKRNGAPIVYDRKQRRYVYKGTGSFVAKFEYIFPEEKK